MVYKLHKASHSLKQDLRLWYQKLSQFLLDKLWLQKIYADHSIFISSTGINQLSINIFMDQIKIMRVKNSEIVKRVKQKLTTPFEIVDIRPISFYFGLKIDRDREKMTFKLS